MPTRTLTSELLLVAHVPVDRFEIVNGPGATKCMEYQETLSGNHGRTRPEFVEALFTLTTAASETPFRRRLRLATIFAVEGGTFNFTAIFSGKVVSGVYDMKERTGWFNLD